MPPSDSEPRAGRKAPSISDEKHSDYYIESQPSSNLGTAPKDVIGGGQRVELTEEDNKRILRKTDRVVLVILSWVYLLQILDKSIIGYSTAFGLREDANLVGNQYSELGSAGYYGQLAIQPLSAYLLVKLPVRYFMPAIVFAWGVSLTGMAIARTFHGLLVCRVLLGIFEAAVLPMFALIVSNWYRRSEQPLRIAVFYSTNGISTIVGSFLSWALGHIDSPHLHSYQIIFLTMGLVTILTAPVIYWKLDNNVSEARFLSPEDRVKAVERLRANQTGTGSTVFKLSHVLEVLIEPKTWMFFYIILALNCGASVANVFGPVLLGSFGFDSYTLTLLNMPFGALQFIFITTTAYLAYRWSKKSPIIFSILLPPIVGLSLLYTGGRTLADRPQNLAGYYLIAPLFAGNPLVVSWMAANTGGQTKMAVIMSLGNAANAVGNIIGPFLFQAKDKPYYYKGILDVLMLFVGIAGAVALQVLMLLFLNKLQSRKRVKNGKPAQIKDLSMTKRYEGRDEAADAEAAAHGTKLGAQAFADLTDRKNDEFIYVL